MLVQFRRSLDPDREVVHLVVLGPGPDLQVVKEVLDEVHRPDAPFLDLDHDRIKRLSSWSQCYFQIISGIIKRRYFI